MLTAGGSLQIKGGGISEGSRRYENKGHLHIFVTVHVYIRIH